MKVEATFFQQEVLNQKHLLKGFEMKRVFNKDICEVVTNKRTKEIVKITLPIHILEDCVKQFNEKYDMNLDFYELGYYVHDIV
jgi:hypothetical protein